MIRDPERTWNPYLAGIALGLVLVASYALTGKGLGASGASFRIGVAAVQAVAPDHVAGIPVMAATTEEGSPLKYWLVFEVLGVVLGGLLFAEAGGASAPFFESGKLGGSFLYKLLGLSPLALALLVAVVAVGCFVVAGKIERKTP